ncbi:MAG: hypothetical protein ACT4OY_07720 [Alphaproteobacteria bacterium]
MVRFNMVQSAVEGYTQLWRARRVFMHLAILPAAIKMATFVAIMSFELEHNYLRQGILLLPSYFIEGWLVAVAIRFMNRGDAQPLAGFFSSREALSCMILYVLAKLAATFVSSFALMHRQEGAPPQGPAEQMAADPSLFLFAVIVLSMGLWMFRFLWLYVPAAMGYGIEAFLKKTNRLHFSFYLIGFWILCFVPFALALLMVSQVLPHPAEGIFLPTIIAMSIAQAFAELCIILVSALGFAHAVRAIMSQ